MGSGFPSGVTGNIWTGIYHGGDGIFCVYNVAWKLLLLRLVSAFVVFLGAGMEMSLLWDLSDVLMGVMALINIPLILILSGTAFKAFRDYEDQLKREVNPVFKSADIGLAQKTDFWN